MGTGFSSGAADSIQFTSTMPHRDGQTVKFWLDAGSGLIMFDDNIGDDGTSPDPTPPAAITSPSVRVTALSFLLDSVDHERITIVMRIESVGTKEDVKTSMDLQTTVSPRRL